MSWARTVRALLVCCALISTAQAAETLRATINPVAPRPRVNGPEWVEVTLQSNATRVREGLLEFAVFEYGERVFIYRTNELAVNTGSQRFRFLLPPVFAEYRDERRTVGLRFVEKDQVTALGDFPLISAQKAGHGLLIGVIRASTAAVEVQPLWQAFQLERFSRDSMAVFTTTPFFMEPGDAPAEALSYSSVDALLIEQSAFSALREKSRAALLRWINAGGTALIIVGTGLEADELELINSTAAIDPKWRPLTADANGSVAVPGMIARARVNFGQLFVAAQPPANDEEARSVPWRKAAAAYWSVTRNHADSIAREGLLKKPDSTDGYAETNAWNGRASYFPNILPLQDHALMPSTVRLIPGKILAISLIGFILLIGPGEWFGLGLLRRRRYTWIVFPVVTIGCTVGMIVLARHYIGEASHQAAVIVTDIGAQGRVIRESRFEFELAARERMGAWPTANGIRVPFPLSSDQHRGSQRYWNETVFNGQFPSRYTLTHPHRQWVGRMMRVMEFNDGEDASGIKWDAFDPKALKGRWSGDLAMEMTGRKDVTIDYYSRGSVRSSDDRPLSFNWRRSITQNAGTQWNQFLYRTAPTGCSSLHDLIISETGDESSTILVATKVEGNNIHLWRRLFLH